MVFGPPICGVFYNTGVAIISKFNAVVWVFVPIMDNIRSENLTAENKQYVLMMNLF